MKKTILVFGLIILTLLLLFKISKHTYLSGDSSIEIIIASIALVFFFVGLFISKKQPKHISGTQEVNQKK